MCDGGCCAVTTVFGCVGTIFKKCYKKFTDNSDQRTVNVYVYGGGHDCNYQPPAHVPYSPHNDRTKLIDEENEEEENEEENVIDTGAGVSHINIHTNSNMYTSASVDDIAVFLNDPTNPEALEALKNERNVEETMVKYNSLFSNIDSIKTCFDDPPFPNSN